MELGFNFNSERRKNPKFSIVVLEEFENGTRDEKDPLVQAAKIAKEYVDKVMSSARKNKAGEVW